MFGKLLFSIVRGWWFYVSKQNAGLMDFRLEICSGCELRKWKVCGHCGCFLKAKASDPDEKCPHPKGDKWRPKHSLSNQ